MFMNVLDDTITTDIFEKEIDDYEAKAPVTRLLNTLSSRGHENYLIAV